MTTSEPTQSLDVRIETLQEASRSDWGTQKQIDELLRQACEEQGTALIYAELVIDSGTGRGRLLMFFEERKP